MTSHARVLPRSLAPTRTQTAQNTEVDELEDKSTDDKKEVKKEGDTAGSGGGEGGAEQLSGVAAHGVPARCEKACVHLAHHAPAS